MDELSLEEAERERRSLAMLDQEGPSWWSARKAYRVVDHLVRLLRERSRSSDEPERQ